uniref:Odorant-binding protein n=1 Tax=Steinernema glaseri TaxID=37863 RepID=A0A1I7XX83_9BILA
MGHCPDVVNYVTGYTAKAESAKGHSMFDKLLDTDISPSDTFKICCNLFRARECSTMELDDMLMSHAMYEFDTDTNYCLFNIVVNFEVSNKKKQDGDAAQNADAALDDDAVQAEVLNDEQDA